MFAMSYKVFRYDINALRAIAVISVVLFHFSFTYVRGGFTGVDVFFVISGFLMTGIVLDKIDKKEIISFYISRFQRIVPALLVVIVSLMIFGYLTLGSDGYRTLSKNALSSIFFFSNYYYSYNSGYFDQSSDSNYLLHTWSLSVEWQFYLLYPLIIFLSKKVRLSLIGFISLITIISLLFCLFKLSATQEQSFYSLVTRAWEMLSGGIAYVLQKRIQKIHYNKLLSYIGFAVVIISAMKITSAEYWPSAYTLIPACGAILILLSNNNSSILITNPLLQWLGRISYSLYLWHWPVIVVMHGYGIEFNLLNSTLGIFASMILAQISYSIIESKFNKKQNLQFNVICFSIVSFMIVAVYLTDGAKFRFSKTLSEIAEYKNDMSSWRGGECFLSPEQDYNTFKKCKDEMKSSSIVIWGDSHAAQMMPGLNKYFVSENITQRTASLCPPLIGQPTLDRPFCQGINKYIISEIEKNKPEIVMLSALWSQYDVSTYLPETLKFLKSAGVKKVIIIGSVPFWSEPIPSLIEKNKMNSSGYISKELLDNIHTTKGSDEVIIKSLKGFNDVKFISAVDIICGFSTCKAIVNAGKDAPFQFDNAHMTTEGSIWLIDKIKNNIR